MGGWSLFLVLAGSVGVILFAWRRSKSVTPREEASTEASILHQLTALTVSLVVFVLVWFLARLLLLGLDHVRGLGNDWLQSVVQDILAPWVGGYAGVAAALYWLKRSTAKFIFLGFSVIVLLVVGAYLGVVGLARVQAEIPVWPFLWGAATLGL
jgi:hypothetical protein